MLGRMARPAVVAAAVAAVALTGCGAAHQGSHAPQARGTQVIVKRDASNGSTVKIAVGDKLEVVLASSYWNFRASSAPLVLRQIGPAQLLKTTRTCVPGGGCRPKRVIYRAFKPGRAVVSAHRVTCGEALACTGKKGQFKITVVVG
jgi:hypothetical protein